ncbi:hypothetical protein SERLA73DRAFT_38448, partial [Serpula lacrymans var. lacrymans S7.3]
NAIWNRIKTTALINYIKKHCAQGGDGLNFRRAFWPGVAADIAPLLAKGPGKSATYCGSKWGRLCTKYNEISAIANLSGVPWDNKLGLNILEKSEAVWAEIVE